MPLTPADMAYVTAIHIAPAEDAPSRLDGIQRTLRERLGDIDRDPALTADGRTRPREEAIALARDRGLAIRRAAQGSIDQARTILGRWQEADEPASESARAARELAMQAAWARLRGLLEAGMSVREVVATAAGDVVALRALERELPTWVLAHEVARTSGSLEEAAEGRLSLSHAQTVARLGVLLTRAIAAALGPDPERAVALLERVDIAERVLASREALDLTVLAGGDPGNEVLDHAVREAYIRQAPAADAALGSASPTTQLVA